MRNIMLNIKSFKHRKFTVFLTVVSLSLSTALLLGVERLRQETKQSFTDTISGTDLIVGARTGSSSLLLSTVFRIGNPSQNISWESYQKIAENPAVEWTIPISLGDSHKGYRVLGTTNSYFDHYKYADKRSLKLSSGERLKDTYDAVLGSDVAETLGYKLGDSIVLSHGAGEVCFVDHADKPFKVVGVLEPTGTPVDKTVHVLLAGIVAIHIGWEDDVPGPELMTSTVSSHEPQESSNHESHEGCDHANHEQSSTHTCGSGCNHSFTEEDFNQFAAFLDAKKEMETYQPTEISAFLVGMKNRADGIMMLRSVNQYKGEALSAILPGVALQELWGIVGLAEKTLLVVSVFVVLVSLSGMLSMLMASLNERRREMAILRSVGARPGDIVFLIVGEAFVLTLCSIFNGIVLLYGILFFARGFIQTKMGIFIEISLLSRNELLTILLVVFVGLLVGFIPALRCYKRTLSDGLKVKL